MNIRFTMSDPIPPSTPKIIWTKNGGWTSLRSTTCANACVPLWAARDTSQRLGSRRRDI
jgi:hypothetical protein